MVLTNERPGVSRAFLVLWPLVPGTWHLVLSADPLPRTIALLFRGVDDPLLRLRVDDFRGHPIEPGVGQLRVPHAPPQFSDQVGQHCSLIARHPIEASQRLIEFPRSPPPEESFGFD